MTGRRVAAVLLALLVVTTGAPTPAALAAPAAPTAPDEDPCGLVLSDSVKEYCREGHERLQKERERQEAGEDNGGGAGVDDCPSDPPAPCAGARRPAAPSTPSPGTAKPPRTPISPAPGFPDGSTPDRPPHPPPAKSRIPTPTFMSSTDTPVSDGTHTTSAAAAVSATLSRP